MDNDHDDPRDLKDFDKFAAEAREYAAGKNRERMDQTRFGSTRDRRGDRPARPPGAPERHREEHGPDQEKRLRAIGDPARQNEARVQVDKHYEAWSKGLSKAYNARFDESQRIYERKIAESKVDERLIPKDQKQTLRRDAVREAVARSNSRTAEINDALPKMIDKIIDDAVKLSPSRDPALDKDINRAKDTAGHNLRTRPHGHGRDGGDRER